MCQQIWKTQQWSQDWKRSIFTPIQRKEMPKNAQAVAAHASKAMLKRQQARIQQFVNHIIPDVQAGFRKCKGTRDQIVNIC